MSTVGEEEVRGLVCSGSFSHMTAEELARRLHVGRDGMAEFVALLEEMERRGLIVRVKKRRWVDPVRSGLTVGRLQGSPRGFGFVVPVSGEHEDVYVAEEDMRDAMDGDLVVVEMRRRRTGRRSRGGRQRGPSGRIIRVIEHANRLIVGRFVPGGAFCRVVPDNQRLFRDVYVGPADTMGAGPDDQVVVELTAWPDLRRNPEGVVHEVLGPVGAPGVDVRSVMFEFDLPRGFPAEVLRAAEALPDEPSPEELARRCDLRDRPTVTVDPADAKDFDDALSIRRDARTGRRVVGVHIADLSHFVRPGDVLDREARQRATSVYLADAVVPILPPEQSRDTLSLVEVNDRLAKTVFLEFDDAGGLVQHSMRHSVVNVDRRMTYAEVQAVLDARDCAGPAAESVLEKLPQDVYETLVELDALAGQLRERRHGVGSIDLDVPDYHVDVGADGRVIGVAQIIRDRAHGLVEEFMLCANRAVATFMSENRLPSLYRVHEPPPEEDLADFARFVQAVVGRKIVPTDRHALQDLLAEVADTNLADAVNMQLLRSMQRALYDPKAGPHYALDFERYCHFTSPVRRYPDLFVHQVLDQHLSEGRTAGELRGLWDAALAGIAAHCNRMRERADEAEREIIKIKLLRYLEQHKDEVFDAVISGVQEYGFFVRLEDYFVEGLVKVRSLRDDFYRCDDRRKALVGVRSGRSFRLGQEVRVVLEEIDVAFRRADFVLHG